MNNAFFAASIFLIAAAISYAAFKSPVLREHPIRAFAALCVAVIASYIMWSGNRAIETLSSSGWCRTGIAAEKAVEGRLTNIDGCFDLFKIQLHAIANIAYIREVSLAISLVALIVIVIAQGRFSGSVSKSGASVNLGRDEVDKAVDKVVESTAEAGEEAKAEAKPGKFTAPPGEEL